MITFDLMTLPDETERPQLVPVVTPPPSSSYELGSIADSLRQLVQAAASILDRPSGDDGKRADATHLLQTAREEYADLEAKHGVVLELVEEIQGIVKPSTSKVSLEVKAAIDRWAKPVVEPESAPVEPVHGVPTGGKSPCGVHYMEGTFGTDPTCPECIAAEGTSEPGDELDTPPGHDADVEEWRQFARDKGHDWPDLAYANRSMIRTRLGIEQPVGEA